jgi:glycosyltransferase involved in cell wall biosynthesis
MQSPLVTIGISCYNCARYLPSLLRSICAQSFTRWEVVAIDDASTDETPDILRSIRDPRFHVVLDKENRGLGHRLNQIANLSQAEFVARTDADDLIHPHRLSRQMACFASDSSLEVCATGAYTIDNADRILGVRRIPPLARTPLQAMRQNGPSHPTVTARRSWFLRYPYASEPHRGQDLDLWIRSIAASRILQLDEPLHFIREDPEFDIAKYRRSMRDHRAIFRRHAAVAGQPRAVPELILRTYAKELSYGALTALGLAGHLAAMRNRPLTPSEEYEVRAVLAAALASESAPRHNDRLSGPNAEERNAAPCAPGAA